MQAAPLLMLHKTFGADAKEGENPKVQPNQTAMTGQVVTLMALLGIGALLANLGRPDAQEISFQHFKTQLLSRGLVDKVEVTNKTTAKVFVRPGAKCASSSPDTCIIALPGSCQYPFSRWLCQWICGACSIADIHH